MDHGRGREAPLIVDIKEDSVNRTLVEKIVYI